MAGFRPEQGDLISISFDPQAGHEQRGRRPALVVSVTPLNRRAGLAFCCPLTNTRRATPFHVAVPADTGLTGFVMCEQLRSLDYRARGAKRIGTAPQSLLDEVLAILEACLFPLQK
jgi:mRNA interferase MazF